MSGYKNLDEEEEVVGHRDRELVGRDRQMVQTEGGGMCGFSYTTRGILYITAGVLVHIALGSVYTFGNISPYMVSYLRNRTSDTNIRNVDALWINVIGSMSSGFGTSFGGIVDRKYGPRFATIFGCLMYSIFVALTYLSVKKSIYLVGITYGLMANIGVMCAYGPTVQTAIKWFPERASLASGLILMGFGGGALIINLVVTGFINPDNLSPDLKTDDGDRYFTNGPLLDRVPYVFLLLAGLYFVLIMLGSIFISNPPKKQDPARLDSVVANRRTSRMAGSLSIAPTNTDKTPDRTDSPTDHVPVMTVVKTLLTNKDAYVLWLVVFTFYCGMTYVVSLYKDYGQTFISDDHFLALVGSLAAVCNSLGRPLWGALMDRYGYQVTTKLFICVWVCCTCTLLLNENIGKGGFLVWVCIIFFCYCGIWPISAAAISRQFGHENMSINFGFIVFASAAGTTISGVTAISLRDIIGWHGIFLMAGSFGVLAFFLTFFFTGKDKDGKDI